MTTDETYMRRCIQLAQNGGNATRPNPMVGAVVVYNDTIIGEGYHRRCGEAHAEVNALQSVQQKELLKESTLYVSLEPCAHYGKTPPCADLIIREKIPHVVVGCRDSFSMVDGKGIQKMRDAGIKVDVGVLEQECRWLNRAFFTFHTRKRPYVLLKWAQSADGFVDKTRVEGGGGAFRFSTPQTQLFVHQLRASCDAILVGTRTALLDNPSLTTRHWHGKNPTRLVIDRKQVLPHSLNLFDEKVKTVVFIDGFSKQDNRPNLVFVSLDFTQPLLPQIHEYLYQNQMQKLLVEGGSTLLQSYLDKGLWDEIYIENSTQTLGDGVPAPKPNNALTPLNEKHFEHNFQHYYHPFSIFSHYLI